MSLLADRRSLEPARPCGAVARPRGVRAYGVLSSIEKDHIYSFAERGFFFTSPWVVTQSTSRYQAVLLLTASGKPFELNVGGRTTRYQAAAIAPMTRRGLCSMDVGHISVHIGIQHPLFHAFRRIGRREALGLDRRVFRRFDRDLVRAYQGRLSLRQAKPLFEELVEAVVEQLPAPGRRDARSGFLHSYLRENPSCTLSDLAGKLGVSYTAASELFSREIGLPLRAYQFGRKCERAAGRLMADIRLTDLALEAGFTDSAHLARTWQRTYGHPPSYTRDTRHVRVFF